MLSQDQLQHVCLLYGGSKQCRYIEQDDGHWDKYYCKKMTPDRKIIDSAVDDFVKEKKDQGVDPAKSGEPLGDNCKGFLPLTDLLQGYDV